MAIKFDTEKVSSFLNKAKEVGKNAAESAEKGAVALSEKVKEASYQDRLKKYNPLFPEEYTAVGFILPHLITIVDEAVRRGIDVCEGAIGWRSVESETEVLHLYNTSTELKEIEFYPAAVSGATYYIDNFNPNRYINVDYIFEKAHEERLAELEAVAYALGAKSCTIQITETQQEANSLNRSANLGGKLVGVGKIGVKAENSSTAATAKSRAGTTTTIFEGHSNPQVPKLKWFADHENIKSLIQMRCDTPSAIKSRSLKIYGASSATMTHNAAAAIDGLRGIKGGISMKSQAEVEHSSELVFSVEF